MIIGNNIFSWWKYYNPDLDTKSGDVAGVDLEQKLIESSNMIPLPDQTPDTISHSYEWVNETTTVAESSIGSAF